MSDTRERSRGEQYARLFRKAGVFAAKGDFAAAIAVLQRGIELARSLGDAEIERTFATQIVTHEQARTER